MRVKTLGSTTLDREDLDRGAEPDNGYYIQNQPLVAGRAIDLAVDPPPDLVLEVDSNHTDIDKNALYAASLNAVWDNAEDDVYAELL